jgi:hypothetical protein
MPKPAPLAFASLAALALAGCGGTPESANEAAIDNAAFANETALEDEPMIEDLGASDVESVEVAALPTLAGSAPAAEVAPLQDAVAIERDIRAGRGIQRIRYGDGWAWMRDGRILRTAADNGTDVAYFRPGEARPFFVQRGERAWGYRDGQATREYGRDGSTRAPDADRQREAQEAWRESGDRRDRAEDARERYGRDRPGPSPSATPSPSPSPTARDRRDRDSGDRTGPRARPTPTPSASPTGRWRSPERTPRREREPSDS